MVECVREWVGEWVMVPQTIGRQPGEMFFQVSFFFFFNNNKKKGVRGWLSVWVREWVGSAWWFLRLLLVDNQVCVCVCVCVCLIKKNNKK